MLQVEGRRILCDEKLKCNFLKKTIKLFVTKNP